MTLRAEVLTYSRARGLFAGISLADFDGTVTTTQTKRVYGKKCKRKTSFSGHGARANGRTATAAYLNKSLQKNLSDPDS